LADPNTAADTDPGQAPDGFVPVAALQAEREQRQAAENRESELRAAQAAPPAAETPPQKIYTREELQGFVEANQITQAQMDGYLEQAQTTRIMQQVSSNLQTQQTTDRLNAEVNRYVAALPELSDMSSDHRQRLNTEITHLVSNVPGNAANSAATQVTALRSAFGDITALEKTGGLESQGRPHHQETTPGQANSIKPVKGAMPQGMTSRERAYYEPRVGPGKLYKSWGDVSKDLEHSNRDRATRYNTTHGVAA